MVVIGGGDAAEPRYDAVTAYWPTGSAPPGQVVPSADGAVEVCPDATSALVFVDRCMSPADLLSVVDALSEACVPGVFVTAGGSAVCEGVLGDEHAVFDASTHPSVIAGALAGARAHGRELRVMKNELLAAQRLGGGIRDRFDKLDQELQLAGAVQRRFLPRSLPETAGVEIGVFYRPASSVSGDVYDARELSDGRVMVLVADAMGHGVPAALMTVLLATSVNAALQHHGEGGVTPSCVLTRMNEELVAHQTDAPRFATAVCAIADPRTREVTVASAGHPPAFIVGGAGGAGNAAGLREIQGHGGLLGIFEAERFEAERATLADGETLVLYTDGFETALPGDEGPAGSGCVGTGGYADAFAGLGRVRREGGVDAAVEALRRAVDAGPGSLHQCDDETALFLAFV